MSPKYFLWTVTDFVKIHKKSLIEKIKEDDRGVKRGNISCTDFQNRNQAGLAPYQVYMRNHILHEFLQHFNKYFQTKNCILHDIWYLIQKKGDFSKRENYPGTQFTNVFYVQLPEKKTTKTDLYDIVAKEGDIVTFPAYNPHISPENKSDEEKIIILFNTSVSIGK